MEVNNRDNTRPPIVSLYVSKPANVAFKTLNGIDLGIKTMIAWNAIYSIYKLSMNEWHSSSSLWGSDIADAYKNVTVDVLTNFYTAIKWGAVFGALVGILENTIKQERHLGVTIDRRSVKEQLGNKIRPITSEFLQIAKSTGKTAALFLTLFLILNAGNPKKAVEDTATHAVKITRPALFAAMIPLVGFFSWITNHTMKQAYYHWDNRQFAQKLSQQYLTQQAK